MAIIPFGLVGTIYGHYVWDVPLSMFSVVGLIGMVGIIINDSIVLVTTVDEYAQHRGVIPAIIDGASDRLRPVLLTTLTTVLGLSPLLFEGSPQAEFLKPTVITLVYGLGFGMFLVLLIVPALLAMQHDAGRMRASARRALTPGHAGGRPVGLAAMGLGVISLAWLVATVGSAVLTGEVATPLLSVLPQLAGIGLSGALGVFLAGALVFAALVWAISALLVVRGRRTA